MSKTKIEVTQDELEALKRYQARKKKKEEAQAKLQKLKTTTWEVPSLEEVMVKTHLDNWGNEPNKEDLKRFVAEAQQLIDFANTMFSEEAIKNHDNIVKKFTKKGWTIEREPGTLDGYFALYNHFTIEKPDFRVIQVHSHEYQYTYHYKVAQDRVIVSAGNYPQLVIRTALRSTKLTNGNWSAAVQNNSIKYVFDGLNCNRLAKLLGEKDEGATPIASALQYYCWDGTIIKQNFDLVMTNKQISSCYKKWYLSQMKDALSTAQRKAKEYEQTYQVISDADFTKILETYRKEE